jgi:hypothetical protein
MAPPGAGAGVNDDYATLRPQAPPPSMADYSERLRKCVRGTPLRSPARPCSQLDARAASKPPLVARGSRGSREPTSQRELGSNFELKSVVAVVRRSTPPLERACGHTAGHRRRSLGFPRFRALSPLARVSLAPAPPAAVRSFFITLAPTAPGVASPSPLRSRSPGPGDYERDTFGDAVGSHPLGKNLGLNQGQ